MLINFYDQVPRVYPNSSRDFQYLSWLINIVLNSVKHNVDDLGQLPNVTYDAKLTELLALTLGFKVKRNYDQKQLAALVSVIPSLLKYKGTEKAIRMAADTLITASGTVGSFRCEVFDNEVIITLPKELVDTTLFMDLLPYILPAGMTCKVLRKTQLNFNLSTHIKYSHKPMVVSAEDGVLSELYTSQQSTDGMPGFAFTKTQTENVEGENKTAQVPNIGILDSNIIPRLD